MQEIKKNIHYFEFSHSGFPPKEDEIVVLGTTINIPYVFFF